MIKKALLGVVALAAVASAAPASAVIVTFANFTAKSSAANVRWVNNGVASNSSASNTSTGTGGYFYTTSTGTSRVPGNVPVDFKFSDALPFLAALGNINANFFMNITVLNSPATASGVFRIQDVASGSFSFTAVTPQQIGNTNTFGTNLLTGTFTNGTIFGTGTSGSLSGDNGSPATLTYTSDFISFAPTAALDYSVTLNSITPALFRTSGRALRTFRANASGAFSSDPAPIVNGVPEPEMWGLMLVGFGMVGVQVRRRARQSAVAA